MTWSLRLRHGDLDLSSASLGTATDETKLVQDLRCFILERMGTDDLHLDYGSLLDGGIRNGQYVEGVVGNPNNQFTSAAVQAEIRRIVGLYQTQQLDRARSDLALYGKATLTKGEVLLSVSTIDITHDHEYMTVTINLTTGRGTDLSLSLGIGN